MKKQKKYDDDDGRTIVDMSGLNNTSLMHDWFQESEADAAKRKKYEEPQEEKEDSQEEIYMTPRERRMTILGTMRAALLIGLCYIVGLGVIIGGIFLFWSLF